MKKSFLLRIALVLLICTWASAVLLGGTGTWAKFAARGEGIAKARFAAWDPDIRWHRLAGAWNYSTSNVAHGYDLPYDKKNPSSWPAGTTYTKGWTDFTFIVRTDAGGNASTGTGPGAIDTGRAPTHLYNGGTEVSTKFYFWKQLRRYDASGNLTTPGDVTAGTGATHVFGSSMLSAGGPAFYRRDEKMAVIISALQHEETEHFNLPTDLPAIETQPASWNMPSVALPNNSADTGVAASVFPSRGYQSSSAPYAGGAMREVYPQFNKDYVRNDSAGGGTNYTDGVSSGNNRARWNTSPASAGEVRTVNVQYYETIEYCWYAEQVD